MAGRGEVSFSKDEMEKFSVLLNTNAKSAPDMAIGEPGTYTAKVRASKRIGGDAGEYRKVPLIGGERVGVSSCYVGKRGKAIIVFTPIMLSDVTIRAIELELTEAMEKVDGFAEWANQLYEQALGRKMDEARAAGDEYERMAEARARAELEKNFDNFGTW